jgi:hypothetical protein
MRYTETERREDAEKIKNVLAEQVINAAIEQQYLKKMQSDVVLA